MDYYNELTNFCSKLNKISFADRSAFRAADEEWRNGLGSPDRLTSTLYPLPLLILVIDVGSLLSAILEDFTEADSRIDIVGSRLKDEQMDSLSEVMFTFSKVKVSCIRGNFDDPMNSIRSILQKYGNCYSEMLTIRQCIFDCNFIVNELLDSTVNKFGVNIIDLLNDFAVNRVHTSPEMDEIYASFDQLNVSHVVSEGKD